MFCAGNVNISPYFSIKRRERRDFPHYFGREVTRFSTIVEGTQPIAFDSNGGIIEDEPDEDQIAEYEAELLEFLAETEGEIIDDFPTDHERIEEM